MGKEIFFGRERASPVDEEHVVFSVQGMASLKNIFKRFGKKQMALVRR